MEWLNYHHLLYFWTVVREGGVSKGAAALRLAQPTISAQLRQLEQTLGERLFERRGRTLQLTDVGRTVYRYAVRGRPLVRPQTLTVGVADALPKLMVYRLLQPAVADPDRLRLVVREGKPDALVAELAAHGLDAVLSDVPSPPHLRVKVFNHLLGESGLTFFAPAPLAVRLRRRFPRSLDGTAMLLPTANTAIRRALDHWFDAQGIRPRVIAEFEDTALLNVFGQEGGAVFPAPTAIERDVITRSRVRVVGRNDRVRERYYVLSAERRLKHEGVLALTAAAREGVFG